MCKRFMQIITVRWIEMIVTVLIIPVQFELNVGIFEFSFGFLIELFLPCTLFLLITKKIQVMKDLKGMQQMEEDIFFK